MIVCEQQSAIVIFLVVGALIAQLGEHQTEDLKVPCSIHGQSREISNIIPCNEVQMCQCCKKYKSKNVRVLLKKYNTCQCLTSADVSVQSACR